MKRRFETHLHSLDRAKALDSRFRRLVQNPNKILKKYIHPGMTVLDLGCGTGYFTTELTKLIQEEGKVIAVNVQKEMLERVQQKLQKNPLKNRIKVCHNKADTLPQGKFDFVLAFYSFHEMEYIDEIIKDLKTKVKPTTKVLIAEQKFHVPQRTFKLIVQKMEEQDFQVVKRPNIFFSRAVLMQLNKNRSS